MENMDQLIESAESALKKLAAISEQEKAMREVFPIRFSQNLTAFEKYIPNIFSRFHDYSPERAFEFYCLENGEPNLRWSGQVAGLYGDSPFLDCKTQIEHMLASAPIMQFERRMEHDAFGQQHMKFFNQLSTLQKELLADCDLIHGIPDSIPLAMMFGLGLGYQLGYLYERCQVANLHIFEPNSDLFFASLFCFDWASLLEYMNANNLGLHLFVGQTEDEVMTDLRDVITPNKNNTFLCANCIFFSHYESPILNRLKSRVLDDYYQLGMGWGFFDDNLFSLSHSLSNLSSGMRFLRKNTALPQSGVDAPVFVVANGPSLDSDIEFIRSNIDKAIIVACGTALGSLCRAGIPVDIYVATERVDVVPKSLAGIPKDYLERVLFLSTDVIHPDCHLFFNRIALAMKADEPMIALLMANNEPIQDILAVSHVNPLVGNIGLSFPLHLGFKQIYLFGLDNGFRVGGHHHSKFSMYYDDEGQPKPQYAQMSLANGDKRVPANFGGEVISNRLFSTSLMMLEVLLTNYENAHCINCSDGAKIRGTTPLSSTEIRTEVWPLLDKISLIDHIYTHMSSPSFLDVQRIKSYMDQNFFNWFVDKVKLEWQSIPNERFALIQMMQKQAEYLETISISRQCHIAYVLSGTFNTLFAMVSVFIYRIDDERLAFEKLHAQLPLILEFFVTLKKLYEFGMDMIQGPHLEIVKNIQTEAK